MGYEVYEGDRGRRWWSNFDALTTDRGHPSRSPNDTFYLTDDVLLRTHTSPDQIRLMEARKPPIYAIMPGRVYRRDTPDATHSPTFLQVEALVVDRGITLADLKGSVLHFFRRCSGRPARCACGRASSRSPSRPSSSTSPASSATRRAAPSCKHSGWIEMGGAGWVDPQVFRNVGYDPEEWSRVRVRPRHRAHRHAPARLPDLRLFWENDVRVLEQF